MDVRKTIAELTSQLSEINYDSDEDNPLIKDSTIEDIAQDEENVVDIQPSNLRKINHLIALPENVYGGKKTTRKKTFSVKELSDDDNSEERGHNIENISGDDGINNDSDGEEDSSNNTDEERDSDEAYSSGFDDESLSDETSPNKSKNEETDYKIYSSKHKNVPSDLKKGTTIRNQQMIWDSLLECRIKLQKALSICNDMPTKEDLMEAKSLMKPEDKLKFNKCKQDLLVLLDKMVTVQSDLLLQSDEFNKKKELNTGDGNDEIPSDESEIEDDVVGGDHEEDEDHPPRKKRKLIDYSSLLKEKHDKFLPFRNSTIQKWNDTIKVSSGKAASSNFSAFDQSTLKQIEQIMIDKNKLISRTRIKRSNTQSEVNVQNPQDTEMDVEIFDDTDFYHKLLRDFIERKAVDATNSSKTERQMIELQKLRSKMKKNVDTKSTKGRKLRYVVLPKLVNFMAPDAYNTWTEDAENNLYSSLFGQTKM